MSRGRRPEATEPAFDRARWQPRQYRLRVAELEAIGITTSNQAASLRFYGLIGVEVPDPGEDHVEAPVRGGLQLMWDTEELIRQIEPDLPRPVRRRIVL